MFSLPLPLHRGVEGLCEKSCLSRRQAVSCFTFLAHLFFTYKMTDRALELWKKANMKIRKSHGWFLEYLLSIQDVKYEYARETTNKQVPQAYSFFYLPSIVASTSSCLGEDIFQVFVLTKLWLQNDTSMCTQWCAFIFLTNKGSK